MGLPQDLIIRYTGRMRVISATEASRKFSDLLDAIERGESVTVTRGNRVVAEIRPAHHRTGRDLRAALAEIAPPDDRFEASIADALTDVTNDRADPWADA
jgi:prevent-host-death family protein